MKITKIWLLLLVVAFHFTGCVSNGDTTVVKGYPWGDWQEMIIEKEVSTNKIYRDPKPVIIRTRQDWKKLFNDTAFVCDFDTYDLVAIYSSLERNVSKIEKIQERMIINHKLKEIKPEIHFKWKYYHGDGQATYIAHYAYYKVFNLPLDYKISKCDTCH